MLYLDNAATTPPYEEVVTTVADVMRQHYGNPSSIHRLGMDAQKLVSRAREVIGSVLHVKPTELIFTSGGTESSNLAIKGAAYRYRNRGSHLITTAIEHASVTAAFEQLEAEGFTVTILPVDDTGAVTLEQLQAAVTDETILVSVMHVNNEMGRIQPIAEIGRWLRGRRTVLFHVDAVQGVGKLPLHPAEMGIDLMSASAHKFKGPKGAGFLYKREGIELYPLLAGGGQEHGMRSGTENVPLIVGMAKALRLATEHLQADIQRKRAFRDIVADGIRSMPELMLTGSAEPAHMAPHLLHFCYPGMNSEVVVHALEQRGIYISTKSACSSGVPEASKVLLAMGFDKQRASSGLRVSWTEEHSESDAHRFVGELRQVIDELVPVTLADKGGRKR
ncbi:cysteine desulfurase family protein [Paenibacillus lutrae]|uniref:Aminotransferase class V-fold PLP-dependent enzyme n=1 Tax=Paenibacillus lutrae TaxID=2078573 RepID=A0A7X3FHE5_9BACL|nr:cysteine desulfurase family protein [Paenibacillus lutrae]MVO99401.1 aminotransferase class V-fold PLP-dependent enzyme [Paenibacillus lutrae]